MQHIWIISTPASQHFSHIPFIFLFIAHTFPPIPTSDIFFQNPIFRTVSSYRQLSYLMCTHGLHNYDLASILLMCTHGLHNYDLASNLRACRFLLCPSPPSFLLYLLKSYRTFCMRCLIALSIVNSSGQPYLLS